MSSDVCTSDCCASETSVRGGLWQSMVPVKLDDDAPNQSYHFSENHPSVPRHWSAMGVCTIIPTKPANSECPFCELWWVWGWLSLSFVMIWSPIFVPTLSLFTTQLLWQTEWWKDILNARSVPLSNPELIIPALLVQLFSLKSSQVRTLGNKCIGFGMSTSIKSWPKNPSLYSVKLTDRPCNLERKLIQLMSLKESVPSYLTVNYLGCYDTSPTVPQHSSHKTSEIITCSWSSK